MFDEAWESLEKAVRRMKKYAPSRGSSFTQFSMLIFKPYHEDLDVERVQTKRALLAKLHGKEMLHYGNLRRPSMRTPTSTEMEKGLMGRPCTHESLDGEQGRPGGLVVQTPGAKKALTAPKGHHGTALGVAAYLLPAQARGRLSLVRGAMPCAPRRITHGRNAMVRCYRVGPDSGSLDQWHVGGHPVTRGTLRGRRQLVRGTLQQLGEKGLRR
ncbi:hypothetical protein AAG906_016433 [Vitis piasezkii]